MSLTFSDAGSAALPSGAATSAKQDTGNTSLATIATNTTGAATAANQTTEIGSLATIATMISAPMIMVGLMVKVLTNFTRPADTTAYAIGDVVSNSTSSTLLMTFAGAGRSNANSGYITKARLLTSQAANVAAFRLWLFNASSVTVANDNAAYVFTYADDAKLVGYIDFPAMATSIGSGTGAFSQLVDSIRMGYVCAAADTALYGFLETRTIFTPANAQTFECVLTFDQN